MTAIAVVGIDPGSRATGITLLDADGYPLYCGSLLGNDGLHRGDALLRLVGLRDSLDTLLERYETGRGVSVAMEHLIGREVNLSVTLDFWILCLGQWARRRGWTVAEYAPGEWRQAAALMGRAAQTKEDVRAWALLRWPHLRAVADQRGGLDALESLGIATHHYERTRIERGA